MLDFFSLGETFLGIGMRLGGGIMQFKMFGNTLYILAHPKGFCAFSRDIRNPIYEFFLQVMYQSTRLKYHFLYFWFGLSEYATDKKNGGSEFYSISTTFGEAGSKFSKNSRSL